MRKLILYIAVLTVLLQIRVVHINSKDPVFVVVQDKKGTVSSALVRDKQNFFVSEGPVTITFDETHKITKVITRNTSFTIMK